MLSSPLPVINVLKQPTTNAWVEQAISNLGVRRKEPEHFLDNLLVTGLIEARSHERLGLLAANCPEPELAKFYRDLMDSEARHFGTYWILADTYFNREEVTKRLDELGTVESEILQTLHPNPRIHS
ncbi:hypothetical protein NIES932_11560 [Raphidiopsis curvata NIES-932]|nr:hypothetical protein NIES932_11560 [Raphidiopsis curvata NIES-932]